MEEGSIPQQRHVKALHSRQRWCHTLGSGRVRDRSSTCYLSGTLSSSWLRAVPEEKFHTSVLTQKVEQLPSPHYHHHKHPVRFVVDRTNSSILHQGFSFSPCWMKAPQKPLSSSTHPLPLHNKSLEVQTHIRHLSICFANGAPDTSWKKAAILI